MPHKILIVEDDPAQRRILEELVKRFGFEPVSADSATQAPLPRFTHYALPR